MSSTPAPSPQLNSQVQVYQALLALLPAPFRAEYGREMVLVFRDSLRVAHRSGSPLTVAFFWLTAVLDLGQSAFHEWLAHRSGPGHSLYLLGLGLVAGAVGGLAGGAASRLAMRGIALAGGLRPGFTLEGTLLLVLGGAVMGMFFGVGFVALRGVLPGPGAWKGLSYGLGLFLVLMVPQLVFYREGEATLASPLVGVSLFAPVFLIYGTVTALAAGRLERRLARTAPAPVRPRATIDWPAVARQVLVLVAFALLVEVAVLGVRSISTFNPRIPPAFVLAARSTHLPFTLLRDSNAWLVQLSLLGYFGVASLLVLGKARSAMARATGLALFLFGAGLFNTGAAYFVRVFPNASGVAAAFHSLQVAGVSSLLALLYLFPHGRPAAAWVRPLAGAWLAFALAWLLAWLPEPIVLGGVVAFFGSGLAAQIQRYRAAPPEERSQLRWPVVGFTVAILGFSLVALAVLANPGFKLPRIEGLSITATFGLYLLPWLFIPLTIAYAMRRHRLWAT